MQKWILAMLAVSAVLLIRDMAKIVSQGKKEKEAARAFGNHPQKERLVRFAKSFEKLSGVYYNLPCQKENQLAVAQQLYEVSQTIETLADEVYDITFPTRRERRKLARILARCKVSLVSVWDCGERELIVTVRAYQGQCVTLSEVSEALSRFCGQNMIAVRNDRNIIGSRDVLLHFVPDFHFQAMYGVAKVTKDREQVSGDSYTCQESDNGQYMLCLSDGMGSGLAANRESEQVVELMEGFIMSGFSKESAARMINSALSLGSENDCFSTVDVCTMNLYTGVCEFLKAGAATTFIRRDNWVETITSNSMAVGLMEQADFELASKKLYDGDYLVMVTDGVLAALPQDDEEETMKNILLQMKNNSPKEMGRRILETVLRYSNFHAADDMTVLVAGMWRK